MCLKIKFSDGLGGGTVTLGGGNDNEALTIDFNQCKANNAITSSKGKTTNTLTLQTGIILQKARIVDEPKYVFDTWLGYNNEPCLIYAYQEGNIYSSTVNMAGGQITGCTVDDYAYLIWLRKGVTFQMTGGAITGNTLESASSAIYAKDYKYVKMNISGGTISGNGEGYDIKDTVTAHDCITLSGSPAIGTILHFGTQPINAAEYSGGQIKITPARAGDDSILYIKGNTDTGEFILEGLSACKYDLQQQSDGLYLARKQDLTNQALIQYYINTNATPQVEEVITKDAATGISLVHPGVLKNKAILDQARDHIRNGDAPWVTDFFTLMEQVNVIPRVSQHAGATEDFVIGSNTSSNKPTLLQPFENDAEEALQQTELWYITGKPEYLANALQIIRGWSHLTRVGDVFDEQIQASRGVYLLCQAAEILRYSAGDSGWTEEDTGNFLRLLDVLEGKYNRITHFMNQDGECIRATMAASIFRNDTATYQKCIERMTINPELSETVCHQEAGACDPNEPCAHSRSGAILYQFRKVTKNAETGGTVDPPNIQLVEMGRDQTHPGADIYNPAHVGITAYIQGTLIDPETGRVTTNIMKGKSIFEYLDNRVLQGADYYCRYNSEEQEVVDALTYYPTYSDYNSEDRTPGIYTDFNSDKQGKKTGWTNHIVGLLYHYYASVYPLLNDSTANPLDTDGIYVKKAYDYSHAQGDIDIFFNIPATEDLVLMKAPEVKGDYDGDGSLTEADVQLFLENSLTIYSDTPTATQKMLFDYNNDGKVDASDGELMQDVLNLSLQVKGAQVRSDGETASGLYQHSWQMV